MIELNKDNFTDQTANGLVLVDFWSKTVLLTDEYAGRGGESQSLADAHPAGDAVVTAGNANQLITLPPMKHLIGHDIYANMIAGGFDGSLHEDGSITVELQAITGATSELGIHTLSAHSG